MIIARNDLNIGTSHRVEAASSMYRLVFINRSYVPYLLPSNIHNRYVIPVHSDGGSTQRLIWLSTLTNGIATKGDPLAFSCHLRIRFDLVVSEARHVSRFLYACLYSELMTT